MTRTANKNFGQRVRVALAASRVPATRLASECGVTRQAVQRWLDGTSMPSSKHLLILSTLTGASIEWIMWPHPVDIRRTDFAPNGIHVKNIVRQALAEIAQEGPHT